MNKYEKKLNSKQQPIPTLQFLYRCPSNHSKIYYWYRTYSIVTYLYRQYRNVTSVSEVKEKFIVCHYKQCIFYNSLCFLVTIKIIYIRVRLLISCITEDILFKHSLYVLIFSPLINILSDLTSLNNQSPPIVQCKCYYKCIVY